MKKLASFIGVALLAACAPMAQAALQISYSFNGAAPVVCNTGGNNGPVTCFAAPLTVAGITVTGTTATSTSPGSTVFPFSRVFESTTTVSAVTAGTLELWIAAQDFTIPSAPPSVNFRSNLATTTTAGAGTAKLDSCVDTDNDLAPPTDAFCAPGIMLTNVDLPYSVLDGANSNSITSIIGALGTPYSLSQHITVILEANTEVNVVTSAVLTQVPEPTSIALLGGALLLVGRAIRRKRNQAPQA